MEELHRFLRAEQGLTNTCLTAIMILDVLIRHQPSMLYSTVGRSFYTDHRKGQLSNGAEVWQGYYQSARPTVDKMMINVDVSATAFYEHIPLIDMVAKILNYNRRDDLRRGFNDRDRIKVEKAIKNLRVTVDHRGDNFRRKFKIFKLSKTSVDKTMFEVSDTGGKQDVASYFRKQYNRRLNFPMLPCVVVQKDSCLPIEVCFVVKGQRHMRKLNEKQTADMIKFTCQQPHARANNIKEGIELLNYRDNDYLKQFGLKVDSDMTTVNARILPAPKLSYHPSSRDANFVPNGGVWNLRDKKVAAGATLGSWSVVHFRDPRDQRCPTIPQLHKFIREVVQTFSDTGMNVVNREPPIQEENPNGNIEKILKDAWLRAGNAAKAQPQLIMCVLPNTGVDLYAEIKRVTDTVIGISSQCVQSKHTYEPKKQYCANVCLKVNLKLGGMNSFLAAAQIPFIAQQPTILFGADVTHPGPGTVNKPSIAAVCGSMDSKASRYSASIRVQKGRVEIIQDLSNMVKELLKTFYQTSGQKPSRILFYRDGVSEGQFKEVMESEIKSVQAACASLDPRYKPPITFVIVQKRHHARFFPMDNNTDRTGNCLAGTVVESGITHPFEFDFYLLSHPGLQGTSRPCHYHVLHDENNFTADALQELTYKLCYLYGRATRAVSIVPPAYYADLVATRARYSLYSFILDCAKSFVLVGLSLFHASTDLGSEAETSTEVSDPEAQAAGIASYGVVKPELQKVMYFM
ncbi:Piwi domain-containing protein [Jimgerdemannia flammicorona]|uniref:Piwi domain-containing protein n=1 Tax=Jimgerdemannia flammicorona TaxID=994334 RepID=A0A433DLA7_9FUNG|nr:Piwi domain-containing protein [Jimgerdemannia flammicorona]